MQAWYSRHYCGICVDVFKIEGIYIIVELLDVIIIFSKSDIILRNVALFWFIC